MPAFLFRFTSFFFQKRPRRKNLVKYRKHFYKKFLCLWYWLLILKVRYVFEILTHLDSSSKPFIDWVKCSSQLVSDFRFSFIGWIWVFRNLSLQYGYFVICVSCKSSCSRVFSQFWYFWKFIRFFSNAFSSSFEPCVNLKAMITIIKKAIISIKIP